MRFTDECRHPTCRIISQRYHSLLNAAFDSNAVFDSNSALIAKHLLEPCLVDSDRVGHRGTSRLNLPASPIIHMCRCSLFRFRSHAGCADHSDCIDPRDVVHPTRLVSNLPKCVTTMQTSDTSHPVPPFPAYPTTERFISLGTAQETLERLERSIQAKDAISVVIGPPGTGKTLLREMLTERMSQSHQVISMGETPLTDSDSFLRRLMHQLGVDMRSIPDNDFQLALFDHLCVGDSVEAPILLLIDEAHSLGSTTLETIRTLTNFSRHGEPRVTVVLFGGNALDESLIAPSLDSFRQRISTRCYLHPLNAEETAWYINQTIRNCGCDPDATITADAISAVHHACSGIPRLINQLLTHAIEFAAQRDEYLINEQIINQSWAQLQQLPSPMIAEPQIQMEASAIEFGELDELETTGGEITKEATENPTDDCTGLNHDTGTHDSNDSEVFTEADHSAMDFDVFGNQEPELGFDAPKPWAPTDHEKTDQATSPEASAENALDKAEQALEMLAEGDPDAISGTSLHNSATSIPQLHYPELAYPALEPDSDDEFTPEEPLANLFGNLPQTPSENDLFGTFNDEEPINLRADDSPTERNGTNGHSMPSDTIHPEASHESEDDLEIMKPDTIQYVESAYQTPRKITHRVDAGPEENYSFDEADQARFNPTRDVESPDFTMATTKAADAAFNDETSRHEDSVEVSDSAQETDQPALKIHLRNDDSDMLIIEDEVDLHRVDNPQASTARQHSTIDYKTMLKRMRSKG